MKYAILGAIAALTLAAPAFAPSAFAQAPRLVASPETEQKLKDLGWNGRYAENCSQPADIMTVPPPAEKVDQNQPGPAATTTIAMDASGKPTGLHLVVELSANDDLQISADIVLKRENDGFQPYTATAHATAKHDLPAGPAFPDGAKTGQTADRKVVADGQLVSPDGKPGDAAPILNRCPATP